MLFRSLEGGRLQDASQAIQLASRLSDEEDVQELAAAVATAFLRKSEQLEQEASAEQRLAVRREQLQAALGEPKTLRWFDGGHAETPRETFDEAGDFLAAHLGIAAPAGAAR